MITPDEEPTRWAIRLTLNARTDISAVRHYLLESNGEEFADVWQQRLETEIMRLSAFPASLPLADESLLFSEAVRKLLFRRARRGPAYHILFTLRQSAEDAPTVNIIHIRHSAQAPMTREEAQEIESAE